MPGAVLGRLFGRFHVEHQRRWILINTLLRAQVTHPNSIPKMIAAHPPRFPAMVGTAVLTLQWIAASRKKKPDPVAGDIFSIWVRIRSPGTRTDTSCAGSTNRSP